jgi:hypothetical protein
MNFIYYSYLYILVVGLILFTNFVLKFGSGYPSGLGLSQCLKSEVYFGSEFRYDFLVSGMGPHHLHKND